MEVNGVNTIETADDGICHVKTEIVFDDVEYGAKEVLRAIRPNWNLKNIKIKHYSEGITNKLFGCFLQDNADDVVMFRIFGENTDLIVDRKAERETFMKLSKVGCSPPLYCVFGNGIAYGFVQGKPISLDSIRDKTVYSLVAKEMVKIHSLDYNKPSRPNTHTRPQSFLFEKLNSFIKVLPTAFENQKQQERFKKIVPSIETLQLELSELKSHLLALNSPVVFCHNDLLLNNIIYDKERNKIGFIDYEYAFYNYQAFDIGDHFCEFAGVDEVNYNLYPEKEFQLKWLRTYLECWHLSIGSKAEEVTNADIETLYVQVNKFALIAHLFWGIWAIVQAKHSTIDFDFLEYAKIRFEEYARRKPEFMALKLPVVV